MKRTDAVGWEFLKLFLGMNVIGLVVVCGIAFKKSNEPAPPIATQPALDRDVYTVMRREDYRMFVNQAFLDGLKVGYDSRGEGMWWGLIEDAMKKAFSSNGYYIPSCFVGPEPERKEL